MARSTPAFTTIMPSVAGKKSKSGNRGNRSPNLEQFYLKNACKGLHV